MSSAAFAQLALKHVRNAFAEELYLRTGLDTTRPVAIYGVVNERCNYRCRYCEYWRLPKYRDEMSIEEWQKALLDLKDFIGRYHIEFSGGEPFIKKGFLDLLRFCHEQGIQWGVTTNGSALTGKNIEQVIAARPFNVNVSIDSDRAEIHDYSRGIEGSLERLTASLRQLIRRRNEEGLDFPVIIKAVVHRLNYQHLPSLVRFVQDLGATGLNLQPVDRWTQETHDELWIEEPELPELITVRDELLAMKAAGAPILNSELVLSVWPEHFRGEKAPPETMPCRVGMRNYFIRPDGNVEVCWFYPPIGNVKLQSAQEIWQGEVAGVRRKETVACESLCLFTCLSQKTIKDKVKMAMTLVRGRGRKAAPGEPGTANVPVTS